MFQKGDRGYPGAECAKGIQGPKGVPGARGAPGKWNLFNHFVLSYLSSISLTDQNVEVNIFMLLDILKWLYSSFNFANFHSFGLKKSLCHGYFGKIRVWRNRSYESNVVRYANCNENIFKWIQVCKVLKVSKDRKENLVCQVSPDHKDFKVTYFQWPQSIDRFFIDSTLKITVSIRSTWFTWPRRPERKSRSTWYVRIRWTSRTWRRKRRSRSTR